MEFIRSISRSMRGFPESIPIRYLLSFVRIGPGTIIESLADTVCPQYPGHMHQLSGIDPTGMRFPYIQIPWERFILDFPAICDLRFQLPVDIPFYHFQHRKQHGILMRAISLMRRIVFDEAIVRAASVVFFYHLIKRIRDQFTHMAHP